MRTHDGICPKSYQWLYDKTISDMQDDKEKAGHIMCDELQIKSTLCWNTQTHALVGFTTECTTLDFLDELKEIEKMVKENGHAVNKKDEDDDKIAKKVNQWRLRTVKGKHHNGEFWFNNGSLTGDELMWQFTHVVSCYEAVGIRILGFECDAGGQNARLLKYLRKDKDLGTRSWLLPEHILVSNPSNIHNKIAIWFCATHQLKNLRNALLRTEGCNNYYVSRDGAPITWSVIEEAYKHDHLRQVPSTDLTRAAVFPDSWSKMNVTAAKAPFTFRTINEMMTNLACDLGCVAEFVFNKTNSDNCDILVHHLSVLKHANELHGNDMTSAQLATIEYCTHVGIIFNETLMNKELYLCRDNIGKKERLLQDSLKYFEDWKQATDSSGNSKAFMSMITYSDLRICVCGFFAYSHLVLNMGMAFVPMLHSNTSILEALFSQVRSRKKETTRDYAKAISTIHAGTEVVALQGNRCKSYSDKDVAVSLEAKSVLECVTGHKDEKREKILLQMKSKATIHVTDDDCCWTPFQKNESMRMQPTTQNDMTEILLHSMSSSAFVGGKLFYDIICAATLNEYSKRFEEYALMSIETESEEFFRNLYELDEDRKMELDRACRFFLTCYCLE